MKDKTSDLLRERFNTMHVPDGIYDSVAAEIDSLYSGGVSDHDCADAFYEWEGHQEYTIQQKPAALQGWRACFKWLQSHHQPQGISDWDRLTKTEELFNKHKVHKDELAEFGLSLGDFLRAVKELNDG